jgi:hypothetical protein
VWAVLSHTVGVFPHSVGEFHHTVRGFPHSVTHAPVTVWGEFAHSVMTLTWSVTLGWYLRPSYSTVRKPSIVSPPGRLRRWPDGRLQGAEVGILLDQVQVDSTIIVGPGVSGTVYGIRTVQWRVASRFVGARSNFYVGFDGARVLGEQVHVSYTMSHVRLV